MAELMDGQVRLFAARIDTMARQNEQLAKAQIRSKARSKGIDAQARR